MTICLANVTGKKTNVSGDTRSLTDLYLRRANNFYSCTHRSFSDEKSLVRFVESSDKRQRAVLVLADVAGWKVSSEEFAGVLGGLRDGGMQSVIVAVGGSNGWTGLARGRADYVISFGNITLPHGLALVVASEQIYRAFTILAGHPYHTGH